MNVAYIDGANLHRGILELGWKLDYERFRTFLRDKYKVEKAYIFIGLVGTQSNLYTKLQNGGYVIIFKPTVFDGNGKVKGNCDAELVLQMVQEFYEEKCDVPVLVSGDGDFSCVVRFLSEKGKKPIILSPSRKRCSILLKRSDCPITFLEELENKISGQNKKAPNKDGTLPGSFS